MDLVMLRKRSQTAEKHCEDKKHAKDYGPDDDERGNRCESPFDHKNDHSAKRHVEIDNADSLRSGR